MAIKHIKQPSKSSLCGQCCVAMFTGMNLNEVAQAVGTFGGTRTKQLLKVLQPYTSFSKLKRNRISPPETCLMRVRWEKGSHWVLRYNGLVHDPELEESVSYDVYLMMIEGIGRITSYLPLNTDRSPHIPTRY